MSGIVRRFTIGAVDVVQILDTVLQFTPAQLFPNAPPTEHAELEPDPGGHVELPVLVHAITVDGSTTLIDTGVGGEHPEAGEEPGQLMAGLHHAGIDPGHVDRVVFTHLHPDHIGGGVDLRGRATFPRAEYVIPTDEWSFWADDVWRSPAWAWLGSSFERRLDPLANSGRLRLTTTSEALTSRLVLRPLVGHSPGAIGLLVDTGDRPLLFIGDALHHPAQWNHPEWHYRDDAAADMASQCRSELFDEVVDTATIVAAAHFPLPGLGHVRREGTRWQPLEV